MPEAINTSIYSPAAGASSSATGTLGAVQNIIANLLNTAANMYRTSQQQATPITQTTTQTPTSSIGTTLQGNWVLILAAAAVFAVVLLLVRK